MKGNSLLLCTHLRQLVFFCQVALSKSNKGIYLNEYFRKDFDYLRRNSLGKKSSVKMITVDFESKEFVCLDVSTE